jgi:23S rRNA (pseudouridine1915-N3)-methyltransferase
MKLSFLFDGSRARRQDFKSSAAFELFSDYLERVSHYTPVSSGALDRERPAGSRLWLCDLSPKAKSFTSEGLAREIEKMRDGGVRELRIGIGASDGFDEAKRAALAPDLLWGLGPMTLPHELAAIVAAEQVYRAFTILKGQPYHK